jgi:hypothetical protein
VSETTISTQPDTPKAPKEAKLSRLEKVRSFLTRKVAQLRQSVFPFPNYLEEEEIQQTIHMAPYRATIPRGLTILGVTLFVSAVLFGILMLFFGANNERTINERTLAGGLGLLSFYVLYKALQAWIAYRQWKFIITNKRIIITTPDPQHSMFADIIYLQIKNNNIKVLDTNFSDNPLWRLLQILSGTRDVMLSPSGYEFMEKGAKVKGGLRFPDVPMEDIKHLERLIFGG